jgi:hypothetical protein
VHDLLAGMFAGFPDFHVRCRGCTMPIRPWWSKW